MVGRKITRRLCCILFSVIFTQFAAAQDTIRAQWAFDATGEKWILREDVMGFLAISDMPFDFHSDIVNKTVLTGAAKNLLVVYFNENASQSRKSAYVENLNRQGLQKRLLAMSKPAEAGSPFNKLLFIDDQVLVVFKSLPLRSGLEAFCEKYELELISKPEASQTGKEVYVFRYRNFTTEDNSATVSSKISKQEKEKVVLAQPNRVNLFEPQSTNDTYIDLAWHVANNGQEVSCSSIQGEHHADAHISGAWGMGYTGQGIRVGVIDFYGFDYNHPDMQGQMLDGWDCINNTAYNASNFHFTDATQAHGMAVCGVIGANGDNGIGAAGVAYGSKIVPFLIDGSESSVILAMQKARSSGFDVDVVNCSFGSYFPSPAIEAEIQNMVNLGRARNGNTYGIAVVTSHGNDNYSDVEHPQYPAAYEEVISVSASTPDDRKKTPGDSWETASAWGTNYGALLDIAAPGVCIFTTDISGSDGYSTGDYVAFQKTSASAPIVAGVAALMLSKNPNMTWQEVITRLEDSADKTYNSSEGGGYNYNHDLNKSGQSLEMGYGRVNAEKALSDTPVGFADNILSETSSHFTVTNLVQNSLDIRYSLDEQYSSYEMAILDMSGRMLLNVKLPAGIGMMNLDVNGLKPGMYLVKCANGKEVISNEKFVKVR